MMAPAITPTLPAASVSRCSQAPRMFIECSRPECSAAAPIPFTSSPPTAIHITSTPSTGWGARKRAQAS